MTGHEPIATELDPRFSTPEASARPWADAADALISAKIYWLTTVRPDGHPHQTPLIGLWLDGAMHFSTGPDERKAKNLAGNPHCLITTGCNSIAEGLDIVLEGEAKPVVDDARLTRLAEAYKEKYGWTFTVGEGTLLGESGERTVVFAVTPTTVFGFGKGDIFTQTRWRFASDSRLV